MYFVYVIYNSTSDKFYIGQTVDLDKRLIDHNQHVFSGYTSRYRGKWKLIYKEELPTRKLALIREKQLKSFRGRQFVKQFIPR